MHNKKALYGINRQYLYELRDKELVKDNKSLADTLKRAIEKEEMKECFKSFAYGSVSDRQTYDDACDAITDSEKLKEFKLKQEDRNRTSMSQWVLSAWKLAERMK